MKIYIIALFFTLSSLYSQFEQPFKWETNIKANELQISVIIPKNYYLYAKRTKIIIKDSSLKTISHFSAPKSITHSDDFGTADIFTSKIKPVWKFNITDKVKYSVNIDFQGCRNKSQTKSAVCFMPASETFTVSMKTKIKNSKIKKVNKILTPKTSKLFKILNDFEVVKTTGGYLNVSDFLKFLDINNTESEENLFTNKSLFFMIFFVFLGGLALNLTPCVLPMIPINLAIIGAGVQAKSKTLGFIRGGVYGLGIALTYGLLGVFAVLTGAKFGSLNASTWFNFGIAGVFVVLSLGMFDIISIDFSRFSAKVGPSSQTAKTKLLPAFFMGVIAALLAGACVAPVVIAVLIHSSKMYANNNYLGLFFPFILGAGMAMPWPIAGAGISMFPKPGKWMTKVKHTFAILILLFAAYYFYLGISLMPSKESKISENNSIIQLTKTLELAKEKNKLVFIDFWASWCKNCLQMEASTFKDSTVKKKLEEFSPVKFQAEDPNKPEIKQVMDYFKLIGLPGYVILRKK